MTSRVAPPTEDEVVAALLRETVSEIDTGGGGTRQRWSPASRIDVAERIARSRGWDGTSGWYTTGAGYTPSRANAIGKWVSIKAVQAILDRLYNEDRAHAFFGTSRFIATEYGVNPRQTYYLSQEALDLMLAERRKRWMEGVEIAARDAAQQKVLAEHAADVERYRQENLTAGLADEPDWQAMLDDDKEAEATS